MDGDELLVRAEGDDTPIGTPPVASKKKSGDRRRIERQAVALQHRRHPLSVALKFDILLHPDAAPADDRQAEGLRCGDCRFRYAPPLRTGSRRYPKCSFGEWSRATHGAGTDVAAWWPACVDYQPQAVDRG